MEGLNKNKRQKNVIPNHLWLYRNKRGYTQKEVAQMMGHTTSAHISSYERGRRSVSLLTALKLGIVLSTPIEFLFSDEYKELKPDIQRRREKLFSQHDG